MDSAPLIYINPMKAASIEMYNLRRGARLNSWLSFQRGIVQDAAIA